MDELKTLKRNMYQAKRFQMYIVLLRIAFTGFICYMAISQIISAIMSANTSIITALMIIIVAYLINIAAYHICMDMTNKYYIECKQIFEEKYNKYSLQNEDVKTDNP